MSFTAFLFLLLQDQDNLQERFADCWQQGEEVQEKLQEAINRARNEQDNDCIEYERAVGEARKKQDNLLEEMRSKYKGIHEAAQALINLQKNEINGLKQEIVE